MSRKKTNKIEAETGEVVQSNRPFIIRNGGIAKPLGQGLYLLGGKTHEQGGIDIDFTGDARIFSAQPILNGDSPAELVARGANPNITFNRQERFKDVNGISDDGSRKAKCGKRVKAEWGMEEGGLADTLTDIIPVVGSAKDITRLIRNPSWKQAGRTLFSVGTDILGYKALTGLIKLARASKAGKVINKIDDALYNITPNVNNKFTNFLEDNYDIIDKVLTETGISAIGELVQQNNDMKNKENSNKKRLGGSTGLIRVQANGKDRLMYVPFTGEETKAGRKKAEYGTRRATDGNRFMSYDRTSYLLNLNKGNKTNINDDKVKEKINDLPSEKDIKPIEGTVAEKENLEFVNGNKTEVAPKSVGKSYHNISASNSSAVARGIARKLNYNFSDHGSTDFRTADLNNAIFTNKPDTVPIITSIYGNDFVAPSGTLGSTRRAIDFKNENRNQSIDNKISVNKISRYYGNNKQGDFIIGDLSNFEDDDYIAAVRNKSMPFNDVRIENGKLYYLKDGQIIESSLPEGENNKHIVYNPKTGKKQFVSTTKDVNKLYDFYKQFLSDNKGLADIILLDNGRFEDNIYKEGRPLTDEEISDYYRNDFNRGFDKVPVLIAGRMKKFGGKVTNRKKANFGLETSSNFKPTLSYLRTHPYSSTKDFVVDVMTGKTRTLDFADPYRLNKTYGELLTEGYFNGTGFTPYGRRINYTTNTTTESNNDQVDKIIPKDNNNNNSFISRDMPIAKIEVPQTKIEVPQTKIEVPQTKTENSSPSWLSKNTDYITAGISGLASIAGSIISNRIANKALEKSKYNLAPVLKIAAPLKTTINVNPELSAIRENLAQYNKLVDDNTQSSAVAVARKQAAANQAVVSLNKIYADKENRETSLINQDRLNRQEVANSNIDAYNTWNENKSAFERNRDLAIAQNKADMWSDIGTGISNISKSIQQGFTTRNNLALLAASSPNVTPELLRSYGYKLKMGGKLKLKSNKKK